MGQVSAKLRKVKDGYAYYCPGCEDIHVVYVSGRVAWGFNGNVDKPSFTPSVKHDWTEGEAHTPHCCHYFITDGNIAYCGDCTHALSGKTVALPDLPEHYSDEHFHWGGE